jgi:hypothetical protein
MLFSSALRVQWAKAHARSRGWNEVLLLKEEMRRVLVYFEYKAAWWVERGEAEGCKVTPELAEGLCLYAEDQSQLQHDLASNFSAKWEALCREGITQEELDRLARVMEASDQCVQKYIQPSLFTCRSI